MISLQPSVFGAAPPGPPALRVAGNRKDFRTLKFWHKDTEFTDTVYPLTAAFPVAERGALADELMRAAQSIELNICESCGALTDADIARHLRIAVTSAWEVEGGLDPES